ncbi:hypothetical protein RRG08_061243 [Elysia crispata]|uniref:Uncharacterized protein n=1 Tax=Elysia crispata TaxID=231223 RepID=A0AAE0ZG50_9GAST|nr:hypothetical protein RRG08_061243 [Elysia crispata]
MVSSRGEGQTWARHRTRMSNWDNQTSPQAQEHTVHSEASSTKWNTLSLSGSPGVYALATHAATAATNLPRAANFLSLLGDSHSCSLDTRYWERRK